MYAGLIPTRADVTLTLSDKVRNHATNPTNFYFYRESLERRWNTKVYNQLDRAIYGYRNPLPCRLISFTAEEYNKAKEYSTNNGMIFIKDMVLNDEFYHWMDGFSLLNIIPIEGLKAVILPRLNHPLIVFSMVTQMLIQKYASNYGVKETKLLLRNSCVRWNKEYLCPTRKWAKLYQHYPNNIFWPQTTFNNLLNTIPLRDPTTYQRQPREETNETFLQGYSTRATDYFAFKYGKTPAYKTAFGVELELENLTPEDFPKLRETLQEHAIFKRDGSVSRGVEICTAPATLDIHKQVFKRFFDTETKLVAMNNCGLHVHVDRKGLFKTQIPKIIKFMYDKNNNSLIENIAGRATNSYCQWKEVEWEEAIIGMAQEQERYRRVNLVPKNTIEFRLFASTKDYAQFSRCLEFVQAVIDYTKPGEHDCSIKEIAQKENFFKYVNKHHQFYPELTKFLKETNQCA